MNENVLEVLMFLFDNYLTMEAPSCQDEDMLAIELEEAGFGAGEINQAFDWLCDLVELQKTQTISQSEPLNAMRIFSTDEMEKLEVKARGYLLQLEQIGVIDFMARELILERAMAFDVEEISLEQMKKIIGLVMLNRPNEEEYPEWVETILFEGTHGLVH